MERAKEMKKQEQERKQRAKEKNFTLHLLSDEIIIISKPKRQKKTIETDNETPVTTFMKKILCW